MLWILAAATVAAPAPAASEPEAVETVEITVTRPVTGTLEQGTQAYKPEFFTPVRPATAMDMIKWLPGFNFEDMRDLRGLGGTVGNVLIDGKPPTSKTDTLSTVLARIPSDQVERVDIIVGGAPGIDMRGREVIANVVMKKTTKTRGSVTATNTTYTDGRVAPELLITAARNTGGKSWDASFTASQRVFPNWGSGRWVRTDGAGQDLFTSSVRGRGGGPSVIGTGSYEFPLVGGRLKLNGSGRWYKADVGEVATLEGTGERYTQQIVDIYRQGELGARYEHAFGKRTNLEAQLLQRVSDHDQTSATRRPPVLNDFDVADRLTEQVARATLRFKRDESLTLEGSAEGSFNTIDTTSTLALAGVPTPLPSASVRVHEDRGELGALASWKPTAKIGVTAAMKLETSTLTATRDVMLSRDLTFWKPRAVLSWTAAKKTQVRLRAEREIGQINFYNYVANAEFSNGTIRTGNPALLPMKTWVGEATVEQQFWNGASAVVALRRKLFTDVVDARYVGETTTIGIGNIGDGEQTELSATVTVPLKRFGLNGAMIKGTVTKSWSAVTDPTTGERRTVWFNNPAALQGELHFTYDLPRHKLNFGFDAFYYGAVTFYRPQVLDRTGAQPRLNLFAEYRIKPDFTVRLEALNVTDLTVHSTVKYYGGPRNVAPLLYADDRYLGINPSVLLRVRRSFN
ncbi:MAG: hypothetical protein B7Y99_10595 [Caulobacterales bacterium 32-69-10]|nr:MAG: hypothetical protein B7Y99_10595 [Caulobacterales bacterium 32-69-10]